MTNRARDAGLALTHMSLVSALGRGLEATRQAFLNEQTGLRECDFEGHSFATFVGAVDGVSDVRLPTELSEYDCRNNRLVEMALAEDGFAIAVARARERYGAGRVAVLIGTTTSGVRSGEIAFARRASPDDPLPPDFHHATTVDHDSVSRYVAKRLGLHGPTFTVSTACSSSSRVFVDAWHLIEANVCDAAVVGGADSLCLMALCGFGSLELLARTPCAPFDADRCGISLGEAAGLTLLERPGPHVDPAAIRLLGVGSSSDAHHMSAPDPQGRGARLAMWRALQHAELDPSEIGYVNLHGTGTVLNDASEDGAVASLFGAETPCSSIKGWTGHTLGAAGIVNVVASSLALRHGFLPRTLNLRRRDPVLRSNVLERAEQRAVDQALINSFGFGGNNCSLVLAQPR